MSFLMSSRCLLHYFEVFVNFYRRRLLFSTGSTVPCRNTLLNSEASVDRAFRTLRQSSGHGTPPL